MFPASLITFRETLEALLVVGIVLTFLTKTNQNIFKLFVVRGVIFGTLLSVLLAIILEGFFGGLYGRAEEIFEGVLMFTTAGFITWMILWVHRQKNIVKKIKERVSHHVGRGYGVGIFFLVGTSVAREGTEMVLYLKASTIIGSSSQVIGATVGIFLAAALGYVLFRWALHVNLSHIFTITSLFLLLFAAGLVSHGVHEFQEIGILPIFSFDPIFNVSHILDHNSVLGSFLRTLFGYTSKPTILEVISYASYIFFIMWLRNTTDRLIRTKS